MSTTSRPTAVQPVEKQKPTKIPQAKSTPKTTVPVVIDVAAPGEGPLPRDEKPKKAKMVRDSFTIPEREYAQLNELKRKCLKSGVHVKKSELLRAGLLVLSGLSDVALIAAVGRVEVIKTGRPKKA
jgi:hypothetical protein